MTPSNVDGEGIKGQSRPTALTSSAADRVHSVDTIDGADGVSWSMEHPHGLTMLTALILSETKDANLLINSQVLSSVFKKSETRPIVTMLSNVDEQHQYHYQRPMRPISCSIIQNYQQGYIIDAL